MQYWLCEHLTILEPSMKIKKGYIALRMILRFIKWDLVKLTRLLLNRGLSILDEDEVSKQLIAISLNFHI